LKKIFCSIILKKTNNKKYKKHEKHEKRDG